MPRIEQTDLEAGIVLAEQPREKLFHIFLSVTRARLPYNHPAIISQNLFFVYIFSGNLIILSKNLRYEPILTGLHPSQGLLFE